MNHRLRMTLSGLALISQAMFDRNGNYRNTSLRPIDDLLYDQRKGKFLNHNEKERIKKYAEEQRKKNLRKK